MDDLQGFGPCREIISLMNFDPFITQSSKQPIFAMNSLFLGNGIGHYFLRLRQQLVDILQT